MDPEHLYIVGTSWETRDFTGIIVVTQEPIRWMAENLGLVAEKDVSEYNVDDNETYETYMSHTTNRPLEERDRHTDRINTYERKGGVVIYRKYELEKPLTEFFRELEEAAGKRWDEKYACS